MPIYDNKCPKCGHEWEARIYKSLDWLSENTCHKCGLIIPLEASAACRLPSKGVGYKISGYAARNSYGLKKFDDGKA